MNMPQRSVKRFSGHDIMLSDSRFLECADKDRDQVDAQSV